MRPADVAVLGALVFLRENWKHNDGAEGDSVRLVCEELERLRKIEAAAAAVRKYQDVIEEQWRDDEFERLEDELKAALRAPYQSRPVSKYPHTTQALQVLYGKAGHYFMEMHGLIAEGDFSEVLHHAGHIEHELMLMREQIRQLRETLYPKLKPVPTRSTEELIEASSLGSPEAKVIRAAAPKDAVDTVLQRVGELDWEAIRARDAKHLVGLFAEFDVMMRDIREGHDLELHSALFRLECRLREQGAARWAQEVHGRLKKAERVVQALEMLHDRLQVRFSFMHRGTHWKENTLNPTDIVLLAAKLEVAP